MITDVQKMMIITWCLVLGSLAACGGQIGVGEQGADGRFAGASVDLTRTPVYFVHGYDPPFESDDGGGSSDCNIFKPLRDLVKASRLDAGMHYVKFYDNDLNCDDDIGRAGKHGWEHPANHDYVNRGSSVAHTRDTPIEHLAYHLAWSIYLNQTQSNRSIDIVAHSMGGLLVRAAIAFSGNPKYPDFPKRKLLVRKVVTVGSPHEGSIWCLDGNWAGGRGEQCWQMQLGGDFLRLLTDEAPNPQGELGTEWVLLGSEWGGGGLLLGDDNTVRVDSAIGYNAMPNVAAKGYYNHCAGRVPFTVTEIGHTEYFADDQPEPCEFVAVTGGQSQVLKEKRRPARLIHEYLQAQTNRFADVPESHAFYSWISCLADAGVVHGRVDDQGKSWFDPEREISKAEMSKLVANAAGIAAVTDGRTTFADVSPTSTEPLARYFYPYIEALARVGVVQGVPCAEGTCFQPLRLVDRQVMAKFVANTAVRIGSNDIRLPDWADQGQTFADVPPAHAFYPYIEALGRARVIHGRPCDNPYRPCFEPIGLVLRSHAAKFIANAFLRDNPLCARLSFQSTLE